MRHRSMRRLCRSFERRGSPVLSGSCSIADVTTIEGLADRGGAKLQALWSELNVPQCGYCQAGMLMAAADLLKENTKADRCRY